MSLKKIIPCMDIIDGRIVKGVNFEGIKDVADPVEMAAFYNDSGADELVFYDIAASVKGKKLFSDLLREVAGKVSIPLIVGGGISELSDIERVFECGGGKVSINTGAIKNPRFIREAARNYGSERIILSMDVKRVDGRFMIFTKAGKENTGIDALEWAENGERLGVGELVVNSIDTDGVKGGFDIEMLKAVEEVVTIPIVASGGAGKKEDFAELFRLTGAETGLAASVFHFKEIIISDLKHYLKSQGIEVRV